MKYLAAVLLSVMLLCGCTQADVDRAKAAQAKAEEILAQAEEAEKKSADALVQVRVLVGEVNTTQGDALLAKAQAALDLAGDATKAARVAVDTSGAVVEAAEKSKAAGGLTVDTLLAGVLAFLTGGASIAATVVPLVNKYRTALSMTAEHADRMEKATTPDEIEKAKEISRVQQLVGGVHSIIEKART